MQQEPEIMKDFESHGQKLQLQDGPDDPHLLVFMPLCNPLSCYRSLTCMTSEILKQ